MELTGLPSSLVQVCLPVRLDDAVRRRVRDAGERVPGTDLRVVEERLVRLVDGALQHLAGARGARTGAAGVGQLDAGLLGRVQDVAVLRHVDHALLPFGADELHLVDGGDAQVLPRSEARQCRRHAPACPWEAQVLGPFCAVVVQQRRALLLDGHEVAENWGCESCHLWVFETCKIREYYISIHHAYKVSYSQRIMQVRELKSGKDLFYKGSQGTLSFVGTQNMFMDRCF